MSGLRRSARVASNSQAKPEQTTNATVPPPAKKAKTEPKAELEQEEAEISQEIEVGDKIPELTLLNQDEKEINLPTVAEQHKYVVIFAYPKASTPGCTRQVCGFQKNYQFLSDKNVAVFGLSADTPHNQKNFQTKQHVEYDLLSDPKKELIGILGAKKQPSGIKRSHWIFVDGVLKVKRLQISPEQSVDGAKEEIEKFIAEANGDSGVKEESSAKNGDEAKPVTDVESVAAASSEQVEAPEQDEKPDGADGANGVNGANGANGASEGKTQEKEEKDNALLSSEQPSEVSTEAATVV